MLKEVESVKSVERAMAILNCFSLEKPELGITELSKKLNASKSTIHRLLTSMQKQGFIIQDKVSQHYKLGFRFLHLSEIILKNMNIRHIAFPILQTLREKTQETVSLNILSNNARICIEKAESFKDLRRFIEIGQPLPLYAGASGKVLLAFQEEKVIQDILKKVEIKPLTSKTVTDIEQIMLDLSKIRQQGYCITSGEREAGAFSISAPIWDHSHTVIASLTISGPSFRFTPEKTEVFLKLLLEEAAEISKQMGY